MSSTLTIPCDHCMNGQVEGEDGYSINCGSCLGRGTVQVTTMGGPVAYVHTPLHHDEAFVYVCAVRYALNRQTYAGGIVIDALLEVVDRLPYKDRKLLEKEIADALFKHEVDAVHREAWQGVVTKLQQVEE